MIGYLMIFEILSHKKNKGFKNTQEPGYNPSYGRLTVKSHIQSRSYMNLKDFACLEISVNHSLAQEMVHHCQVLSTKINLQQL